METGSKMSLPSTSSLSVNYYYELLKLNKVALIFFLMFFF